MLLGRGYTVTALARDPKAAARALPVGIRVASFTDDMQLADAVGSADVVVNLAGEPIAGARWTSHRKRALNASRVDVTRRLVAAIGHRPRPLPVFVSASATGWYGDRGEDELDDTSPPGDGFAADLCLAWESEASAAQADRVVIARFGIILGREGGALAALRPLYRLGLGGPLGDGNAWMPWVHLDDAARAIIHAIERSDLNGPVAVVAPNPVRQRDFAHAYGHSLHRPAILRTPRAALSAALGEAASIALSSQRVLPRALLASELCFRFPTLGDALADLVDDGASISRVEALPTDSPYLHVRGARYVLRATTELAASRDDVFAFFSSPENLAALTPPSLGFEIQGENPPEMKGGALIDYKIHVAGVRLGWRTCIERWQPNDGFVDSQLKGPYRSWWHEHRFYEGDGVTVMEDAVYFSAPLGALGRLVVEDLLTRIFGYRRAAIRARFEDAALAERPAARQSR
jgi:uncharacterized protein